MFNPKILANSRSDGIGALEITHENGDQPRLFVPLKRDNHQGFQDQRRDQRWNKACNMLSNPRCLTATRTITTKKIAAGRAVCDET
ncbi:MAG: hypothetical protein J2P41_16260 [Blastocatellia bacterium]|nr:hypothetical protein [Blastocatellia bacterium]